MLSEKQCQQQPRTPPLAIHHRGDEFIARCLGCTPPTLEPTANPLLLLLLLISITTAAITTIFQYDENAGTFFYNANFGKEDSLFIIDNIELILTI